MKTSLRVRAALVGAAALALGVPGTAAALPIEAPDLSNSSVDLNILEELPRLLGVPPQARPDGKTHCTSVVQIGDSTSVIADDASALPAPDDAAGVQYRRVGVAQTTVDALSGRAIIGGPGVDAEHAVAARKAANPTACWVIAMGVNDAGAIAAGSAVTADQRIDAVMRQLAGRPVLWPTVATSTPSKQEFGQASMAAFDAALRRATTRYANLAVYDWSAAARPDMFGGDGIHYTPAGYAERNRRFADALATAYPTGGDSTPTASWIPG